MKCDSFIKIDTIRILLSYSKLDQALFIPHLGLIEIFSAAINRAGFPAKYTEGFNPILKINFASPAPIGLSCKEEIACIDLTEIVNTDIFINEMNKKLPKGIFIHKAELFTIPFGERKYAPSALLWGFRYGNTRILSGKEKEFRNTVKNPFEHIRDAQIALNPYTREPEDYFEVYQKLYNSRQNKHYE